MVDEEDDGGVAGIGETRLPDLGARGQGWVWLQALFILLLVLGSLGPQWPATVAASFRVLGSLLLLAGIVQLALGLRAIGPSLGISPHPASGATLRSVGLLARVRHPLYGGWMVAGVGWSLIFSPCCFLPALLLIIELDAKRRVEERMLVRVYPGYIEYAKRVRRSYLAIP